MRTAADILEAAVSFFRKRNAQYGSTYLNFGKIMAVLYPDGWNLRTVADWNRAAIVMQVVTKLMRYARTPGKPHPDSVWDMINYSAMLKELDELLEREQ